jgi:hypothetical protein
MSPTVAALLLAVGAAMVAPEAAPMSAFAAVTQQPNEAAKPAKPTVRIRAISGTGTQILNGAIASLDPNTQLRGSLWRGAAGQLGVAGKMMRDAHVRQSVGYRTAPLCGATWRFRPASKSPRDREAADFAKWCFLEQLPWDQLVKRTVGGWSVNGFSLGEMTDDYAPLPADRFPLHPGGGRGIVPTGVHEIPASTVSRWFQSKTVPAQLGSLEQYVAGSDTEQAGYRTIPADRILRWTLDQEGADFEGMALLRSAYAAWKMRQAFMTIQAIKHERRGVGTPVAIAGEGANDAELDAVETALAEMRANAKGELVLPHGWEFSWEGGSQSDETNIEAAIAACNQEIAINASAGFMMLGQMTPSGSYALGATQQGQYHLAVLGDARFFATGWNLGFDGWSPVARIVRLNYGEDVGVPILEARNLPTSNWSERIPLLINAANVGVVTPDEQLEDAVREALEFDPHDEETARPRGGIVAQKPLKTARDTRSSAPQNNAGDKSQPEKASDEVKPDPKAGADAPDDTTPKEQQTIFGYHLQYGVAKINEARKNLNLEPVPYGEQTVPEFLATVAKTDQGEAEAEAETDDSTEPGATDPATENA